MSKHWTSNAQWPKEDSHGIELTQDEHPSEEHAKAVCQMLERDGLGGEGKIFPIKTWVEAPGGGK